MDSGWIDWYRLIRRSAFFQALSAHLALSASSQAASAASIIKFLPNDDSPRQRFHLPAFYWPTASFWLDQESTINRMHRAVRNGSSVWYVCVVVLVSNRPSHLTRKDVTLNRCTSSRAAKNRCDCRGISSSSVPDLGE